MQDSITGIRLRIKNWTISVINLAKDLPKEEVARVFTNQLLRSATSVGANYEEASEAESPKDLIHKLAVVKKEAKESRYWLDLINTTYPSLENKCKILIQESTELIKIFSSIISKKKTGPIKS